MNKKNILCVVGTRPEAIKMAPVILALKSAEWANVNVLATAQHREMLDQVLEIFRIEPDIDLDIMRAGQDLAELTTRILTAMNNVLEELSPDMVLIQGDTTTVMATAIACFYRKIPVAHVEAGLRTGDIGNPFPEEMNRVVAGRLSALHFAPTESSKRNLIRENIPVETIYVTGNTVIDALLMTAAKDIPLDIQTDSSKKLVLMTSHRRENFGEPIREAFSAVRTLVEDNEDIEVLYPVHPNPNVLEAADEILKGHPRINLVKPMEYAQFVQAMKLSYIIISDSGGVQEEAPALAKPVLVLRNETERPEAVDAGVVRLVGTDRQKIIAEATILLNDQDAYRAIAKGISPYGDGNAAKRIVEILDNWFH